MASSSSKRRSFYTDLDHLRKCFDQVDRDGSGFIGCSELSKLVESMPDTESSVVPELMEKLDRDKDGKVSFNDFVRLFEMEREGVSKKQNSSLVDQGGYHNETPNPYEGNRPANTSSPNNDSSFNALDTGGVVLRQNPRRMTLPARLQRYGRDLPFLSPIQSEMSPLAMRPPSNDLTDLASQMKYLTDANESTNSPQLKRNSKVLSWIESEDLLFEDTGTGLQREGNLPSPPLSPTHDEASHVGAILESVCNSKVVSSKAIAKLCDHVKADSQEQQELLALLHHLDKESKGFVSVQEFAQGLQAIKNSVAVGTTTPIHRNIPRRAFSEITPPRLSEPFSTPNVQGNKPPPLSSTPMVPSSYSTLIAVDPDKSGFVKVDDVINYWQTIGIEAPHDKSLENIITESLSVDPSGRVSISDLTATLEGSILTDGKKQNVLRQVALKSFKNEISTLRTQIHQVSLERDKLKSSLNRTVEEKQKLITEGDEHVDMITKKSEKERKEQEVKFLERIKDVEKTKQQDTLQLQERASNAIKDLEDKMKELRREEEKLREKLKFAQEDASEVTQQLMLARKDLGKKDRTIALLQKELGNRSEHDIVYDESYSQRVVELENELTDKGELVSELQDKLRAIQDTCDELKAENERMKQKNLAQKRSMQKSNSLPNTSMGARRRSKHNRPLSGSHFHKRSMPLHPIVPTSMDLDLAVQRENHPVLLEEEEKEEYDYDEFMLPHLTPPAPEKEDPEKEEELLEEIMAEESEDTTESEEDVFAQSTTSLMDEIRQERMATFERKRSKDLSNQLDIERRRHEEIVALLKQDNARLEEFAENQQDQVLKLEEEKSQVTGVLKELKYELESERKSHEVEVNILSRKLENAENEVAKLEEEQRLLREDFEVKFLSARAKAETDISTLQGNLQSAISDQNALQKEISELKGKLETQKRESLRKSSSAIAMLENKHKEQSRAIKERHTAVVEKLQEKLNASVKRERSIKHKLEKSSGELKALLDQLHEKEDSYEKQISTLEASNVKYLAEVSQLKTDCTKLQGEISQMKTAAIAYKNEISSLKAELQRESDFEDYPSLPISSRRSSTSSESSRHGEIISKMKLQLEELQNVLETKSANGQQTGEISEFELINKLIANSSALDAEVQKMRRGISAERLAHLQICAQKDENFYGLQVENETQQKLIKGLTLKVSEEINSKMNTLQSECSHFILGCRTKLDGVMLQLATIAKSLKDANLQHSTEISTLSTNLDQSRNEIQIYRDKLDRLHLELETTRHNLSELSESQDQLIRIQQDKDLEMDELRSRLEQIMEINHSVDVERAPTTFFGNIKVDADSGQVIADHEEAQTREELLLLKEETILSLRNELEQLKEAERHVRVLNEEANRKLIEREREMKKTKQEAEILRIKTAELESKLKQQSLESIAQRKELAASKKSLLLVREELQTSRNLLEQQTKDTLNELERKHLSELKSVQEVVAKNTSEAGQLYGCLLEINSRDAVVPQFVTRLSHSQIITESMKEIDEVRDKFTHQQTIYNDLEATLAEKLEEHELFETQFTAEHEEEVRALRQQKQHLMKQLEEVKEHYQAILDDQEQQNGATVQELMNSKNDTEKQLKNKTEEAFHIYQKIADLHEERKILIDIMKQLCIEAGRHIDIL